MPNPVRRTTTPKAMIVAAGLAAAACSHAAAPASHAPAPVAKAPAPIVDDQARAAAARADSIARSDAAAVAALRREAAHRDSVERVSMAVMERQSEMREALISAIHFDLDKADIRQADRAELDRKAAILLANRSVHLQIEGNAEEREGHDPALAMRRAAEARRYLSDHGADSTQLGVSSNGTDHPLCVQHEESCEARNRRDEFLIVDAPNLFKVRP